jgi:hypothetical protein
VDGENIVPVGCPLTGRTDLERLELRVSRRCHFKIELREPTEADGYTLQDAGGASLAITVRRANMSFATERAQLTEGRSEMATCEETARTLVLLRGKTEVRRVAIALKTDAPTILQP